MINYDQLMFHPIIRALPDSYLVHDDWLLIEGGLSEESLGGDAPRDGGGTILPGFAPVLVLHQAGLRRNCSEGC